MKIGLGATVRLLHLYMETGLVVRNLWGDGSLEPFWLRSDAVVALVLGET